MIAKDSGSPAEGDPSTQTTRQHKARHEKLKEEQCGRAGGEEAESGDAASRLWSSFLQISKVSLVNTL